MIIRFSQKVEEETKKRIRDLWNFVQSRGSKDLLVKVFFYKGYGEEKIPLNYWNNLSKEDKEKIIICRKNCKVEIKRDVVKIIRPYDRGCNGNFREITLHGFYNNERSLIRNGISRIITLKLSPLASDERIISIMAHEYRHYLQSITKTQASRHKQTEKDAKKYAEKIVEKWRENDRKR